ncbi:GTP-binding protein [Pisolithus marmoratus]|nr:GTP-binding protein [Pisolithus marmoratus]
MANIKRFRVLVMGRANAGKTTILQRVCNSKDKPETYDGKGNKIDGVVLEGSEKRGYHHIEYELRFQSNPRLAFHDSCGFEAGSPKQFDEMKGFVVDHAAIARSVNNRIHAIWYCIPMTDCQRTVTAAEKKFFDECDTGHVPVIVLLTKCDTLNLDAIQELEDEGLEVGEVQQRIPKKERELLEKWLGHLKRSLTTATFHLEDMCHFRVNMHQENVDCNVLMQCTANLLNEKSLQKLLISTQQSSIALCVEYAVNK